MDYENIGFEEKINQNHLNLSSFALHNIIIQRKINEKTANISMKNVGKLNGA